MTEIILVAVAVLAIAVILLWPQPSDAAGDVFRRRPLAPPPRDPGASYPPRPTR